jgi:hypothetical protein
MNAGRQRSALAWRLQMRLMAEVSSRKPTVNQVYLEGGAIAR